MLLGCALSSSHVLMLVLCLSAAEDLDWTKNDRRPFHYGTFPTGFSWGARSSAYQTKGAWDADGKGVSIWDIFSHKKGKIFRSDTGDSSFEGHYKPKEDVSLLRELNLSHCRFSLSWPQIIPTGRTWRKSAQQGLTSSWLLAISSQEKSYITCDCLCVGQFTTCYMTEKSFPLELVDPRQPNPSSKWLYSVPWGFRCLLNYVNIQYGIPVLYVTENGMLERTTCTELCNDWSMQYFQDYINEMLKAVQDRVNVRGCTAWSLLDKFEWNETFSERFRLYYIDFKARNKPCYPKASSQYYNNIVSANRFPQSEARVDSWKWKVRELLLHQSASSCSQKRVQGEQRTGGNPKESTLADARQSVDPPRD
ncbi:hypothetical protein AAFF_G00224530 [Aldrovandia affinis]|uniref:Beta-glucosidase n=1 Tax=Aldrovandia affinis TaxID=143900 RepID=A0AAD7TB01_9TELE|nr:hypothetical protein AAFF_G00224530 [Aldrovandia affinis]